MLIIARKGLKFVEIKINIDAPGLEKAITLLAGALNGSGAIQTQPATKTTKKADKPTKKVEEKKTEPEPDTTEDAAKESTGLTFEQVRVKLAEVSQKGKQKELKDLITSFGAEKLSDIPEEKYAELLEKADDL